MWLAQLFSPAREQEFLALLKQQSSLLTAAAQKLHEYFQKGSPQLAQEIDQIEKQGDDVLIRITTALRDAFVTPIDREDIYALAEAIDDMTDYLNSAASEIALFKLEATEQMLAMTSVLQGAAEAIGVAVGALKTQPQQAWAKAREASSAENECENRYRRALVELFDESDVHRIFKLREIYRHLSNSADRAEAIGRLIGRIVVKAV